MSTGGSAGRPAWAAGAAFVLALGLSLAPGCHPAPPPPRVPVPADDGRAHLRERDEMRPLPAPAYDDPSVAPPFDDPPLVSHRPPEQRAFVDGYRAAGSPRMTLFVAAQEGGGPNVAAIDFDAVETIMSDWLASNGQVTVVAPTVARRRLNDAQARSDLAEQLGADVVIYVRAAPTPASTDGQDLRLVAQAINTRGGESIGRAVVDVPPPLNKGQINDYTRFLARKLMDDMTQTWMAPPPPDHDAGLPPASTTDPVAPNASPSTQPENR